MANLMDAFGVESDLLQKKAIFEITFSGINTKFIGSFFNTKTYLMDRVSDDFSTLEKIKEMGKGVVQSEINRIERDWIDGRTVINGIKEMDKVLSERALRIISGLVVEESPHRLMVGFLGVNEKCDVFQKFGRSSCTELNSILIDDEFRMSVKNQFNSYGDESYLFALRGDAWGISFEILDSDLGIKNRKAMKVIEYNSDSIIADDLSKYMDISVFINGVK